MKKLKLPKNPYKGLVTYCGLCKTYKPSCKHFDKHEYRIRIHIQGTSKGMKIKKLISLDYEEAIREAIEVKKELESNNYQNSIVFSVGNDYSLVNAVIKYNQYLSGQHEMVHKRKTVSPSHRKECIRFCKYFSSVVKKSANISQLRVVEIQQRHVASFYSWAEGIYSPRTFNKCMGALKAFFDFLIYTEDIEMKNPFRTYVSKSIVKKANQSLTREEFDQIIEAVDSADPFATVRKRKERKNMFRPYLKHAFRLFVLTGGRREEVISLKWKDIFVSEKGILFFIVRNLKVERSKKGNETLKYFPINNALLDLLVELGYETKKGTDEYVLFPERTIGNVALMDILSKAFTHYKNAVGIEKDISLMNLRKTYISWLKTILGARTGIVTSHAGEHILEKHYIDPTILPAIEEAALGMNVFGKKEG